MLSYLQLIKSQSKTRKNIWYLCGDNDALICDAIDLAKQHVYGGVSDICLGVFFGNQDLAELTEFVLRPYYEERKLVIIYSPSSIQGITSAIDTSDSSTFYLLVDYETNEPSNELHEFLTKNSKAKSIHCTIKNGEELKEMVKSRLNIDSGAVDFILSRANNDAEWLLNKISILERLDVSSISMKLAKLVCTDSGTATFEEALSKFDKQLCFLYINSMGVDDISPYKLISKTHDLSLLNTAYSDFGKQIRAISDKTGLNAKVIGKNIEYASYYDSASSKRCFMLLMKLHNNLVRNNRLAYIALVSGW